MLTSRLNVHQTSNYLKIVGNTHFRRNGRITQCLLCSSNTSGRRYNSRQAKSNNLFTSEFYKSRLTPIKSLTNAYCTHSRLSSKKHFVDAQVPQEKLTLIKSGPGLEYFIANSNPAPPGRVYTKRELEKLSHPYVEAKDIQGHGRKVYFEVYGCQMNVSDTEVVWSILKEHGYLKTSNMSEADVVLVMTCSIREGAEQKIWHKLDHLRGIKRRRLESKTSVPMKIGILGCMAERLKKKLVEKEKCIDVVAGPDSYRDLPRLLSLVTEG